MHLHGSRELLHLLLCADDTPLLNDIESLTIVAYKDKFAQAAVAVSQHHHHASSIRLIYETNRGLLAWLRWCHPFTSPAFQ